MPARQTLILSILIGCLGGFGVGCSGDEPIFPPVEDDVSPDGGDGDDDTADPSDAADVAADADAADVAADADAAEDARPDTILDVMLDTDSGDGSTEDADAPEPECTEAENPRFLSVEETAEDCSGREVACPGPGWSAVYAPGCGCGCLAEDNICPNPDDPGVVYVSDSIESCAVATLTCESGTVVFDGPCGCGCVEALRICPDPLEDGVHYSSTSPSECAELSFACLVGDLAFSGPCGCGCMAIESDACPAPAPPLAQYWADAVGCARAGLSGPCESGNWFDNECGCGCMNFPPACPDPNSPRVRYNAEDPDECGPFSEPCADGSFVGSFDGPCGCGCVNLCPVRDDPRVYYAGSSRAECDLVFFDCPAGWHEFREECGCGCFGPETLLCEADKFESEPEDVEAMRLGQNCESLLVCSSAPLYLLQAVVQSEFDDVTCSAGASPACPEGSASHCQASVGEVDADEILAACALSSWSIVSSLMCGAPSG